MESVLRAVAHTNVPTASPADAAAVSVADSAAAMQKKLTAVGDSLEIVRRQLAETGMLVSHYADGLTRVMSRADEQLGLQRHPRHHAGVDRSMYLRDKHVNAVYNRTIAGQSSARHYKTVSSDVLGGSFGRAVAALAEVVPHALPAERTALAIRAMKHETLEQWPPMASDAVVRKRNTLFSARRAMHIRICRKAVDEIDGARVAIDEKIAVFAEMHWSKKQRTMIRALCADLADLLITKAYPALGYANCASHDPIELLDFRKTFAAEEAQEIAARAAAADEAAAAVRNRQAQRRAQKKAMKAARTVETTNSGERVDAAVSENAGVNSAERFDATADVGGAENASNKRDAVSVMRTYFERYGDLSADPKASLRDWLKLLAFTDAKLPEKSAQTVKDVQRVFNRSGVGLIPSWESGAHLHANVANEPAQAKAVDLASWLFAYASPAEKIAFADRVTASIRAGDLKSGAAANSVSASFRALSDNEIEAAARKELPLELQPLACVQGDAGALQIFAPPCASGAKPPMWSIHGFTGPAERVIDVLVYALFKHDPAALSGIARMYGALNESRAA